MAERASVTHYTCYHAAVMPSERIQRQIDRLLDDAEAAVSKGDWQLVNELTQRALTLDPENDDARALLAAAKRGLGDSAGAPPPASGAPPAPGSPSACEATRNDRRPQRVRTPARPL